MCYSGKCDGLFFAHAVLPSAYSERFTMPGAQYTVGVQDNSGSLLPRAFR